MSTTLVSPADCCSECPTEPLIENIPGPQGEPGTAGTNGTDGENAFTLTTLAFTQPASAANVTVDVADSDWMGVGQKVFVEVGGYYDVVSKPSSLQVILTNLDYAGNAVAATVIPIGAQISPGGIKGVDGSVASGDMLAANNLSDVDDVPSSRNNLGLGTMAVETAANYLTKAGNLTGLANNATARTNLGVTIGTDVQAYDALLLSLAALATVADRMPYFTGVDVAVVTTLTA